MLKVFTHTLSRERRKQAMPQLLTTTVDRSVPDTRGDFNGWAASAAVLQIRFPKEPLHVARSVSKAFLPNGSGF